MKTKSRSLLLAALTLIAAAPALKAQLVIPSDGSDGDLIVATNTVIDLSKAVTGSWDANNDANKGKGIYDSNKWAVVFKYSSVTISNGATLSFANHASRAPVVWLVKGDVNVLSGSLSVDGRDGTLPPFLAEPGPGGFRGGAGDFMPGVRLGPGFGPGGGQGIGWDRSSGSYGSVGNNSTSVPYGNASLLPLIGGSGGSGDVDGGPDTSASGGGGGGAMLIAAGGEVQVAAGASIRANGGSGWGGANSRHSAGGSGGGIRVICSTLSGAGVVSASAGGGYRPGGLGRIRLERVSNENTLQITPDPSVVTLQALTAPLIWLPADGPSVRIVSVGGQNAPADPRSGFGTLQPDVSIPSVSTAPVLLETRNVEDASSVIVRVSPRANGAYSETKATVDQVVSTSPLVIRWTANVPVNAGYSALQVKVVRP